MSRFRALFGLLMIVWIVELVNLLAGHRLNSLGLLPRTAAGLPGVVVAPLLHASVTHALSNTGGLLILGGLVALRGEGHFVRATIAIALLGGALVWLFGRPALHVGASGLVFGYFGILVSRAWHERSLGAVAPGLLAVSLFGGLLWGLSPLQAQVSWEAHGAGLIAGAVVGRLRLHARD